MEQPASMRHDDKGPMNDSDALLPGHIQRANIWRLIDEGEAAVPTVRAQVLDLCARFTLYPDLHM